MLKKETNGIMFSKCKTGTDVCEGGGGEGGGVVARTGRTQSQQLLDGKLMQPIQVGENCRPTVRMVVFSVSVQQFSVLI